MPTSDAAEDLARARRPVLARVVANILAAAAQVGLPREELLATAGLGNVDFSDPDARLPEWAEVALWQLVARRDPDPGLGIRMGGSIQPREWGLLGYAIAYSSTLGAALRRLERYWRILNEAVQFRIGDVTHQHVAVAQCPSELGPGLPHAVSYRFAVLVETSRRITRTELMPAEVAFAFEQPPATLEFHRCFRCPVRFGRRESTVTFAKRDLELPVPGGDEVLASYLSENAERVLERLRTGTSTREHTRSAIWAGLSEGPPTLAGIASALHMPPRTLQRHLAAEGTTFRREIEQIRAEAAGAILRERAIPIEEVAFLLGYTEASTFYRSFKRWTGKTPRQYRASAAQ